MKRTPLLALSVSLALLTKHSLNAFPKKATAKWEQANAFRTPRNSYIIWYKTSKECLQLDIMERSHNFNSMSSSTYRAYIGIFNILKWCCYIVKESSEKPDIKDFKLGQAIGEGNFSQIVVATHVTTHEVFALKIIEKKKVKRLRIRHANIFNEINMEKEVLNKLRHPNIIRLYHTFQVEYTEDHSYLRSLILYWILLG